MATAQYPDAVVPGAIRHWQTSPSDRHRGRGPQARDRPVAIRHLWHGPRGSPRERGVVTDDAGGLTRAAHGQYRVADAIEQEKVLQHAVSGTEIVESLGAVHIVRVLG